MPVTTWGRTGDIKKSWVPGLNGKRVVGWAICHWEEEREGEGKSCLFYTHLPPPSLSFSGVSSPFLSPLFVCLPWPLTGSSPIVWGDSCKNITVSLRPGDQITARRGLSKGACPKCLMNLQVNCEAGSLPATHCQHLTICQRHTSPFSLHTWMLSQCWLVAQTYDERFQPPDPEWAILILS